MYRICTTEGSAARQRQIEARLLSALRARHLDQITVQELCEPLGISRRAFYHYFSSKDDALTALLDHTLLEYAGFDIPAVSGKPEYFTELKRFVLFWRQQEALLDALRSSHLERLLSDRTLYLLDAGEFVPNCSLRLTSGGDRELLRRFTAEGIYSVIFAWQRHGFRQSPDQITELLCRMLLSPIVTA